MSEATVCRSNYWPDVLSRKSKDICISGDLSVEGDLVEDSCRVAITVQRDNHVFAEEFVISAFEWSENEYVWTCALWSVVWQKMLKAGYSE